MVPKHDTKHRNHPHYICNDVTASFAYENSVLAKAEGSQYGESNFNQIFPL